MFHLYRKSFTLVCTRHNRQISVTWLTARDQGQSPPEGAEDLGFWNEGDIKPTFKKDFPLDVKGFSQRLIEAIRRKKDKIPAQILHHDNPTSHLAQTNVFLLATEEVDAARCAVSRGYRALSFRYGQGSSWPAVANETSKREGKYVVTDYKHVE